MLVVDGSPVVSVVIPVRNGAATLGEQLQALARQETSTRFEVVICDNGSTDETVAVAQSYADRLELQIVDASGRVGAAHARNVGIEAARGDIVVFCDADDVVSDSWVEVMSRTVRPGHVVAGWLDLARLNPEPDGGRVNSGIERSLTPISGYKPGIGTGNVGIWRADVLRIGGFDESYRYGVEDIDFGWRAQQAGLTLSREPAVVYVRLRSTASAAFGQHRRWGRGNIMLRSRHADVLGSSMSFRYSVRKVLNDAVRLPMAFSPRGVRDRRAKVAAFGTAVGELEGHLLFRWPGGLPPQELLGSTKNSPVRAPGAKIVDFARGKKHQAWRTVVLARRRTVPLKDEIYRRRARRRPFQWSPDMAQGAPQHGFIGHPAPGGIPVPRRIFLLWTGDNEMPPARRHAVDEILRLQSDSDVVLVKPENLDRWVLDGHPLHPAYEYLSYVHRSDYLRAYLMHHHGGGYSDIKIPQHSWTSAWERFLGDDAMVAIGYTETTSAGTGRPDSSMAGLVRRHFPSVLGMCAFIMRPGTSLTEMWLRDVESLLEREFDELRQNPGGVWGEEEGYPLRWTALLGDILHPWMLVHAAWIGHDESMLPNVDMSTYR